MSDSDGGQNGGRAVESHMGSELLKFGLQYGCYILEATLIIYAIRSGRPKQLVGPLVYATSLLLAGAGRTYIMRSYGLNSPRYGSFYWTSDVAIVLAAFAVVCVFFYRASVQEEKIWSFVRVTLAAVFLGVTVFSLTSLYNNRTHLFTRFIIEFGQNLYFTCLVLITLLYILMQQIGNADDELGFLVCGMGIQFAGPAASLALFHLTSGEQMVRSLTSFIIPVCTLAMLVIWLYALTRKPQTAVDVDFARGLAAWPEPAGDLKLRLR